MLIKYNKYLILWRNQNARTRFVANLTRFGRGIRYLPVHVDIWERSHILLERSIYLILWLSRQMLKRVALSSRYSSGYGGCCRKWSGDDERWVVCTCDMLLVSIRLVRAIRNVAGPLPKSSELQWGNFGISRLIDFITGAKPCVHEEYKLVKNSIAQFTCSFYAFYVLHLTR
jgi:hypothetical protein